MTDWGPKIIDLMDRLGVPFNRTPEGFLDRRRFGGTLFKRTAFAGATTGQQLLYALDEQVRRWETVGQVKKYEFWDFLGPIIDDNGWSLPRLPWARFGDDGDSSFPADAVIVASGGCGLILRPLDDVDGLHRQRGQPLLPRRRQVRQRRVHPSPSDRHSGRRQAATDERVGSRRRGPRVGAAQTAGLPRSASRFPEAERYYFLEDRYPKYKNLVPRDIATREIFDICT
jgi:succinate dehydrogenase / fumarate reductase flavoprotein subunit